MHAALIIAAKDLRQKLRDRSALLVGVVAPLALAALFGSILGGLGADFGARWGFADMDGGQVATGLRDGPLAAMEAGGGLELVRLSTADEARRAVEDGRVEAAIIVPAGFSAAVGGGTAVQVELLVDSDASVSGQVAAAVLARFADQVDAVELAIRTAIAATGMPDAATMAAIAAEARDSSDPVSIEDIPAVDRQAPMATHYAAAMAIVFVFIAAQLGLISLHAERRSMTLARILAAPVPWWSIVAGKVIVALVIALVSLSVVVLGTSLLLGASWGDPLAVAALILATAVAATGVALLAVAFTRTEDQAGTAVAAMTMTLAILGGAFFPTSQGPEVLSQLAVISPHHWFLAGIDAVAGGGGLGPAAGPAGILALIGLVTGTLGAVRARRLVLG